MLSIVVVEDHDLLREATVAMLRANGHAALGLFCAEEVDEQPAAALADLYVVDLNLPGQDGLALTRRLRAARPGVGIVMVTARTGIDARVAGYGSGADIYLPKPVDPAELLAAVQALGQRLQPSAVGGEGLRLEALGQRLAGPAGAVALTLAESQMLTAFAQAAAQTLERWQVAQLFGLGDRAGDRATLDVRVSQLRHKLLQAGAERPGLQAIRGHGYRLCVPLVVV